MKRYGMTIRIKAGAEEAYREHHARVWPEVLEAIRASNIANYSIFLKEGRLYSYFEYVGDDFQSDMAKMARDARTREWWDLIGPMQEPLETRKSGEWWAEMEEVFHFD
jgi:L-rhamnose mutarotase